MNWCIFLGAFLLPHTNQNIISLNIFVRFYEHCPAWRYCINTILKTNNKIKISKWVLRYLYLVYDILFHFMAWLYCTEKTQTHAGNFFPKKPNMRVGAFLCKITFFVFHFVKFHVYRDWKNTLHIIPLLHTFHL